MSIAYALALRWIEEWRKCREMSKDQKDAITCDEEHLVTGYVIDGEGRVKVVDIDSPQKLVALFSLCKRAEIPRYETCGRDICAAYIDCGDVYLIITKGMPGL